MVTYECFVNAVRGSEAEIGVHVDGRVDYYVIPADRLAMLGIADGDDFYLDADDSGPGFGRIRPK